MRAKPLTRITLALAVSVLVLPLAGGCGGPSYIDRGALQGDLAADLSDELKGFPIAKVTCPKKIKAVAGTKVTCVASTKIDQEQALVVTVKDADGGYTFHTKNDFQTISRAEVQAKAEQVILENNEVEATATCPDVIIEKGHTFTCTAKDSSGEVVDVKVAQDDDEGQLSFEW